MEPLEDRRFLTATTLLNDQTIVETANTTRTWSASADFPHTHEVFAWSGGANPGRFSTNPPAGGTKADIRFNGAVAYHKSWTWVPNYPGATYYTPIVESEWRSPDVTGNNSSAQIAFEGGQAQFQISSSGFDPNHAFGANVQINAVNIAAITPDVSLSRISGGSEDPDVNAPTGGPMSAKFQVYRVATETQIGKKLEVGIKQYADKLPADPAGPSDFSFPDSVTILPGMHSATFDVAITDDSLIEPTEQFALAVTDAPAGTHYAYQPDVPVLGQIVDNDWKIKAFHLDFDGDQTIRRDKPVGNNGSVTTFAGTNWVDIDGDGKIDPNVYEDLNSNGVKDEGEEERSWPASYVRSGASLDAAGNPVQTRIKLTANFDIKGAKTGKWKVTGTGGGFTFEADNLDGNVYASLEANAPLGDTIDFFDKFEIDWKVERTPIKTANAVGNPPTTSETYGPSKTTLYVTGAAASGAFHTVIDIGSRNARGLNPTGNQLTVADLIFADFRDGNVTRAFDGRALIYDPAQAGHTAATPLSHPEGHGQCSALADLLYQALKYQGVAASKKGILPPVGYDQFRVKDAVVLGGVALSSPSTEFTFHVIVKLDADPTRIYDASFGVMTPKGASPTVEQEWEQLYVLDFHHQATATWFGSNPPGQDLDWGDWPC